MLNIKQLISELCPKGVEYKPLGELCSIITKQTGFDYSNHIKNSLLSDKKEDALPYIQTKFFTGKNFIYDTDYFIPLNVADRFPKILLDCKCLLFSIVGASIGNIGLFPGTVKAFCGGAICVAKPLQEYNIEYLYYYLSSSHGQKQIFNKVKGSGQATITIEDIRKFEIPVPPLPIQEEIVRILDKLTEKTDELIAELNSELEERKKQYSYYIDSLFDFDETVHCQKLIEFFPFIRNGFVGTVTKHFSDASKGIRYLQGTNVQNGEINDNQCFYITKEFHSKHIKNELKPNDILMVQSGHVGECAIVGEKYAGSNCHALIVMSNGGDCNSMYVVDYFHTTRGKKQLNRITTGGTIKHILASGIKEIAIPFPDIQQQNHIVKQIDSYKALYGKLIKTISEEIQTRKKQYEYYRDKLLTF